MNSGQTTIPINKRFHTDDGTNMIPQFTIPDRANEDIMVGVNRADMKTKGIIILT